jgi:stress-induced-phosphoprotein 1
MKELAEVSDLKKSADACFGEGEIDGAIDLYSKAIERDPRFVSAVSNRAGALLAKGQYEDCIADCDSALNMLANLGSTSGPVPPPGSEKRRDWVIRTVCRRAKAKSELGSYNDAVTDMEMALKMVPEGRQKVRDDLEEDIEVLRGMAGGGK